MPANNQTLTAQWTAETYNVTFDSNGGSTPDPGSITVTYDDTYGTLPTVDRTGHTFEGWFTESIGGSRVLSDTTVNITEDQTLYAQWTAETHEITFEFASARGSFVTTSASISTSGQAKTDEIVHIIVSTNAGFTVDKIIISSPPSGETTILVDVNITNLDTVSSTTNNLNLQFVEIDDQGRIVYSFTMHSDEIRIIVIFKTE
jgi:uncharacterized repeat protein (TIGR02543 family)